MTNLFGRAWAAMLLLLVIAESIFLGTDLNSGNWKGAIVDGILLAFWTFAVVWFHYMALQEQKRDAEFDRHMDELNDKAKDLADTLIQDLEKKMAPRRQLIDLFKEVTGVDFFDAKTVSAKHKAEIEKRYHELTGNYATITVKSGGVIGVNITSDKPTTKKAPVKKSAAPKAPVTKKPVTKKKGTK